MPIEIRPPLDDEWPACRMLVPEPFEKGARPQALLAFDCDSPRILGAAAFDVQQHEVALYRIRVVRTERRKGIASRLLAQVLRFAREREKIRIAAFIDTLKYPDADPFLSARGFHAEQRIFTVEVDLALMREEMGRLRERVLRSRRIPASVRVVPLAEAPTDQVAKLYGDHILTQHRRNPAYVAAQLDDRRFSQPTSVLMVGERVAAMVVVRYETDSFRAEVPAKVVLPEYRGGWANILIMADALDKGAAAGIRSVRFDSLDNNRDTLKLARKFNAETLHAFDRFVRPVDLPQLKEDLNG
jgi:GNAT superfamily N-acetyltransferase